MKKLLYSILSKNKSSYIYTIPTFAGIAAILLYLNILYPQIPYEFGGAKPRSARLDLVRSDFSIETISQLVESKYLSQKEKILPSKNVNIYLVTKDVLIIRAQNIDKDGEKTFEILRSAVKSIHWNDKNSS